MERVNKNPKTLLKLRFIQTYSPITWGSKNNAKTNLRFHYWAFLIQFMIIDWKTPNTLFHKMSIWEKERQKKCEKERVHGRENINCMSN